MKAVCINLKSRPDRWEQFTSQKFPFEVERFEAIGGGSVGCMRSHRKVLIDNPNGVLVFEDDCHILQDWSVLEEAFMQLPLDWDMLYLGALLHAPLPRFSANLFRLRQGWSTHGILYHKRAIQKILSIDSYKDRNYDTFLARRIQPEMNCFIIYPLFATQYPGHSDIINAHREVSDLIPNYEKYTG